MEFTWPQWQTISVYQPLLLINASSEYNGGGVQLTPGLALNYTTSDDNLTYTLNLRQGVNFSSGNPFNAYSLWAQWYIQYFLSGNSSAWVDLAYAPFNMSNVNFGPATISMIEQSGVVNPSQQLMSLMENSSWPIYITGPYTIAFHLVGPFLWFPILLTSFNGEVYDVQWAIKNGGFGNATSPPSWFYWNPPPGTGPYKLVKAEINSYAEFTQNPTYWGANLTTAQISANPYLDPGHVKNVLIQYKADDLARFTDLSTGAAQLSDVLAQDWPLVTTNPTTYSYVKVGPESMLDDIMAINTQIAPTNVTAVRQAIVRAINYTQIIQEAFEGQATPMMGPEYTIFNGTYYDLGGFAPYSYNLTAAIQILKQNNINPANLYSDDICRAEHVCCLQPGGTNRPGGSTSSEHDCQYRIAVEQQLLCALLGIFIQHPACRSGGQL